jgi:hypothetical protein
MTPGCELPDVSRWLSTATNAAVVGDLFSTCQGKLNFGDQPAAKVVPW